MCGTELTQILTHTDADGETDRHGQTQKWLVIEDTVLSPTAFHRASHTHTPFTNPAQMSGFVAPLIGDRRPFMWFFVVTTCSARPVALKKHQRQIDFGYSIELKNNESWISSDVAFSKQFALVSLLLSLYMFFRFASGGTVFQAYPQ